MTFYVYVDRTDDGRPFYVGKGRAKRLRCQERNDVHQRISDKHGCHRSVELITSVEQLALDTEVELIAEYRTQCNVSDHWGANLTSGGEGVKNSSPEVRAKMSEAQRNRAKNGKQTRHSAESKERIRLGIIKAHAEKRCGMHGKKHSIETIEKMKQAQIGSKLSNEAKRKVGKASRERWQTEEFRQKHAEAQGYEYEKNDTDR